MVDLFTTPDASENLIFFAPSFRLDNQLDVLTNCFVRSVAEDSLGGGIQDIITPSRVLLRITSSDDATIAARCAATSSGAFESLNCIPRAVR